MDLASPPLVARCTWTACSTSSTWATWQRLRSARHAGGLYLRVCTVNLTFCKMLNHNLGSFIWSLLCNFDFLLQVGERSEKAQEMHQHNDFYTNYNTIVSLTYTRCTHSPSTPRTTPRWRAIAV